MKKFILLTILVLAGCSSSGVTKLGMENGRQAYRAECNKQEDTLNTCFELAKTQCGSDKFDVVTMRDFSSMEVNSFTKNSKTEVQKETKIERYLVFTCR